jgi:hypothetical protein
MDLKVDPDRYKLTKEIEATLPPDEAMPGEVTGIFVRALGVDGRWDSYDIWMLDADSALAFIQSRGEVNDWAVAIIMHFLQFQKLPDGTWINPERI